MPTQWVTTVYAEGVVTTDDPENYPLPSDEPKEDDQ